MQIVGEVSPSDPFTFWNLRRTTAFARWAQFHVNRYSTRWTVANARWTASFRAGAPLRAPRRDGRRRFSGKRGKRYLQREHLLEVGGAALDYLTEITHRRPREWVSEVDRLHGLLQRHGKEPLRIAFGRAVAERTFGAEYVSHYLDGAKPRQGVLPL